MVILSWIIPTSLHYLTTHIPGVIHLNYLSHLPIIYVASTFLVATRVINDWNNPTSDIVTNSSLNSFKSVVDNYFYDSDLYFIVNVFIAS